MTSKIEVKLKPFGKKYILKTFGWVSNPNLQKQFLMRNKPTWATHKAYFAKILSDSSQRVYAIFFQDKYVGNCGVKNISLTKKEGELWIYIGEPTMRNKGIGKIATKYLIDIGFKKLGLGALYVHVADFNISARRLYECLGFQEVPLPDGEKEWANRECKIIRMEMKKQGEFK